MVVTIKYYNTDGEETVYAVAMDLEALSEFIKVADRLQEETYDRGPVEE